MNRRTGSRLAAILIISCIPAAAQWLDYRTPGIPRTPDSKPNLSAPAPRKPDGKPDLAGIWGIGIEVVGKQSAKYILNIGADLKPGELPLQPWAEALTKQRLAGAHGGEDTAPNCLPSGVPRIDAEPFPFKIIQEPNLVVILYEAFGLFRQIFLDGRTLSPDPNPTWLGYSVGRWDGDVLVVNTTGFNGKTSLDSKAGPPTTDALHVTERVRRRDFGHLDIEVTIDDPKAYTRPWTVTLPMQLFPDTELAEYVCNENEKDLRHLK